MILLHVLSMGNRLIKCFPIRTISLSRETSQYWACIQFFLRHFASEKISSVASSQGWGFTRELEVRGAGVKQTRGKKRTITAMINYCCSQKQRGIFLEVNLRFKYMMLSFVGYLWQWKADLEKDQSVKLVLWLRKLALLPGSKVQSSLCEERRQFSTVPLGAGLLSLNVFSFGTWVTWASIRRTFFSCSADGRIYIARDELLFWVNSAQTKLSWQKYKSLSRGRLLIGV